MSDNPAVPSGPSLSDQAATPAAPGGATPPAEINPSTPTTSSAPTDTQREATPREKAIGFVVLIVVLGWCAWHWNWFGHAKSPLSADLVAAYAKPNPAISAATVYTLIHRGDTEESLRARLGEPFSIQDTPINDPRGAYHLRFISWMGSGYCLTATFTDERLKSWTAWSKSEDEYLQGLGEAIKHGSLTAHERSEFERITRKHEPD
jgi:hypothetical protein